MRLSTGIAIFCCFLLSLALPALAGIEPRLQGDWMMESASPQKTVFHVMADGRYRTTLGSASLETGKFDALDGKWSVRSDVGRTDTGTFSLLGDMLTLRSSAGITTQWKRVGAAPGPGLQATVSTGSTYSPAPASGSVPTAPSLDSVMKVAQTGATISNAARGFRGGVKSGIAGMLTAAQQAAAINQNIQQNIQKSSVPGSGSATGTGAGNSSALQDQFNKDQLGSLAPATQVSVNPQADETTEYGVGSFETRARGPLHVTRISIFEREKGITEY
ncbi:MAG: hypothetical protein AB7W16_05580 [Candidatus Obscuribacterales bacterium]